MRSQISISRLYTEKLFFVWKLFQLTKTKLQLPFNPPTPDLRISNQTEQRFTRVDTLYLPLIRYIHICVWYVAWQSKLLSTSFNLPQFIQEYMVSLRFVYNHALHRPVWTAQLICNWRKQALMYVFTVSASATMVKSENAENKRKLLNIA